MGKETWEREYTYFQCNNCFYTYRRPTRKWYAPHPKVHTMRCPKCHHNEATATMYTKSAK